MREAKREARRNQEQMVKTMLQVQEAKRKERAKVNYDLGYYSDRTFIEGEEMVHIRQQLQETKDIIEKKELARRTAAKGSLEEAAVLGSLEFYNRQLSQLQRELDMREIEVLEYKERMRLVIKEKKSRYYN